MLWVIAALVIFIVQIGTVLVFEFRNPQKTVAWLLILFIFPVVGYVMYYFFAKEYQRRRKVRHMDRRADGDAAWERISGLATMAEDPAPDQRPHRHEQIRLFRLLKQLPYSPITSRNEALVLTNGDETYRSMLEAIEAAQDHIHMEYYIIRSDRVGARFLDSLARKAREGVQVRLIYDGIGSYYLEDTYLRSLRGAGVEAHSFLPPLNALFDKRINYRNHRKMTIVDGKVGFIGGINIGDEYLGRDEKLGFWRDTHMRLEGDSVYFLQHTFSKDWKFVSGAALGELERYYPAHGCRGSEVVQIVASGPDGPGDGILEMFFAAITSAAKRIYLTSPYFIPDPAVLAAIKTAAISGVDVRVIIPGVADSKLVQWATLSYVEDLLHAGVRFFRYQKGFVHAKVMIVDHIFATVGTANMDMRSFFSNFELNAVTFDERTIRQLEADFMADLADSEEVDPVVFDGRSNWQKGREVLARLLSPLL